MSFPNSGSRVRDPSPAPSPERLSFLCSEVITTSAHRSRFLLQEESTFLRRRRSRGSPSTATGRTLAGTWSDGLQRWCGCERQDNRRRTPSREREEVELEPERQ